MGRNGHGRVCQLALVLVGAHNRRWGVVPWVLSAGRKHGGRRPGEAAVAAERNAQLLVAAGIAQGKSPGRSSARQPRGTAARLMLGVIRVEIAPAGKCGLEPTR